MAKFTKEEQQQAIQKVIELINKYHLVITTEHQIKILPAQIEE